MDVVFSDLHIGIPTSAWQEVLTTLHQIQQHHNIDSVIFAGDTVDLTYGDSHRTHPDFNQFCDQLNIMNLLRRTVFIHGNHDPTLPQLPTKHKLTYRPAVILRHPDTNILILHGHGTGLITATHKHPTIHAAFTHVKQQLITNPPPWTHQITKNDWFIAGHRTAPHLNTTTKTAGLSPWIHSLTDHWHGHYITIQPHPTLPPVTLHKYSKP